LVEGEGDRQATEIIEPLASTYDTAQSRGLAELRASHLATQLQITVPFRAGLLTGQIVEVQGALGTAPWRGQLVGIAHRVKGPESTSRLTLLGP
jgi:hypothetical protein